MAMREHFDWRSLTLSPRHFSWRIRGNPLALLYEDDNAAEIAQADLVVATSMTDLASLRGLCPTLTKIPNIIYFHENQFAFPETGRFTL